MYPGLQLLPDYLKSDKCIAPIKLQNEIINNTGEVETSSRNNKQAANASNRNINL